jgi:hypothetical protein
MMTIKSVEIRHRQNRIYKFELRRLGCSIFEWIRPGLKVITGRVIVP